MFRKRDSFWGMGDLLELIIGVVLDSLGWDALVSSDTWWNRIIWGAVIALIGGLLWWELR